MMSTRKVEGEDWYKVELISLSCLTYLAAQFLLLCPLSVFFLSSNHSYVLLCSSCLIPLVAQFLLFCLIGCLVPLGLTMTFCSSVIVKTSDVLMDVDTLKN